MDNRYLTESQRRDLFRLAAFGMVLMLLAVNGGRYLSISPSLFVVSVSALIISWLAVTHREPDPGQIRLDRRAE